MIKRWGLVLVVAAVLLAGCSVSTPAEPLRLGEAPWRTGEETIYDVLGRDGQRVGDATWKWERDDEGWVLLHQTDISGNVVMGEVHLDGALMPLHAWREASGRRVEARYQEDVVILTTTAADGTTTTREVAREADTLSNEQTLQTQRALPMAADYATTYQNLVASTGSVVRMTITVAGREQITVPAGSFAAWHVEIKGGGSTHEAWYGVESPHLLLRYLNRSSGAEFQLRAWRQGAGAQLQGGTDGETTDAEEPDGWEQPKLNWPYVLAALLLQFPLMVVLPLFLGWQAVKRGWATWGVFWAGALTFVLSQVVHLPLNWGLGLLGATARGVALWPLPLVAVVAGLSAGLCESVARWIALRFAMRRTRGFRNAVQFGLGHGAVEAVLLGLIALSGLINIFALWRSDPAAMGLTAAQQSEMAAAFAELDLVPWYMPALGGLERVFAMCLHVAMSVLVMNGIMRRKPINLLWAILAHAAVDAWAVWAANTLGIVWTEVGLLVAAALCVAYIVSVGRSAAMAEDGPS